MAPPSNKTAIALEGAPRRVACTICHIAKRKCIYSGNNSKCDRCIRLNKPECIPIVSQQGKKSKSKNPKSCGVSDTVRSKGSHHTDAFHDTIHTKPHDGVGKINPGPEHYSTGQIDLPLSRHVMPDKLSYSSSLANPHFQTQEIIAQNISLPYSGGNKSSSTKKKDSIDSVDRPIVASKPVYAYTTNDVSQGSQVLGGAVFKFANSAVQTQTDGGHAMAINDGDREVSSSLLFGSQLNEGYGPPTGQLKIANDERIGHINSSFLRDFHMQKSSYTRSVNSSPTAAKTDASLTPRLPMHTNTNTVSLRQWINGTIKTMMDGSNNTKNQIISSPIYLAAALTIAVSLSEQIHNKEHTACEADCVIIKVHSTEKDDESHPVKYDEKLNHRSATDDHPSEDPLSFGVNVSLDPPPHSATQCNNIGVKENKRRSPESNPNSGLLVFDGNMSRQLSGILGVKYNEKLTQQDTPDEWLDETLPFNNPFPLGYPLPLGTDEPADPPASDVAQGTNSYEVSENERFSPSCNPNSDSEVESFSELINELGVAEFHKDNDQIAEQEHLNYLSISSVEVQRPRYKLSRNDNDADRTKIQSIYHLGLVFYELFSGDAAPSSLHDLASYDGAFVSLPRLSLLELENTSHIMNESNSKRQQGPKNACNVAYENLMYRSLPISLCTLIFNMLDCIYGNLSGKDSYTSIEDVTLDLRMMLDRPHKFLCDIDMNELTKIQLQLNRETEFQTVVSCFHRCIAGSYNFAIITGASGVGKSWLAQHVSRYISSKGAIFLSGKFDQMRQVIPFAALASAFSQYCDVLLQVKSSYWAQSVIGRLNAALGDEAHILIKIIPKLSSVLDTYTSISDNPMGVHTWVQNSQHAIQRLHYLFSKFVESISIESSVPVVMHLDDMQWADDASIAVLRQILRRGTIFFLGCCRDNEMPDDSPFRIMLNDFRAQAINSTTIELNCMGRDTLNEVISDTLCLAPRLVKPLSGIIFSKTNGNPLFVLQLMLSLKSDKLLSVDLKQKRWVWDEEKIYSMKLPDNIAKCFTNGISKLSPEIQSALHSLSMFGASAKSVLLKYLESKLDLKLTEPLNEAVSKGLVLENQNGTFSFSHDRIQAASYGLVEPQERVLNHLRYAKCLVELAHDDDAMLFTAVHQFNLAGVAAIRDAQDFFAIAKYNLIAGERSAQMSDFSTAYTLFCNGISFLPENHWHNHYRFSLEIYEWACNASLASGNIQWFGSLASEVIKHARSFGDKLNVHFMIMTSLSNATKMVEALEQGLAILSQLGEHISIDPSEEDCEQQTLHTLSKVTSMADEDILNYQIMTDVKKLAAMRFLARLQYLAYFVKPHLNHSAIVKIVDVSIVHGLSPISAMGFASFGSLLAKRYKDIEKGRRFTNLGKLLLNKDSLFAGAVLFHVIEVQCHVEPLHAAMQLNLQAEYGAISLGDAHWACIHRMFYSIKVFWSGEHLSNVNETFSKACSFIKEYEHQASLYFTMINQRVVSVLLESEQSDYVLTVNNNNTPRELLHFHFWDMYLVFILLKNGDLKEKCEKYFEIEAKIRSNWLLFYDSAHAFIAGLAAFQLFRRTGDAVWAERGRKCKQNMKHWADHCAWNFMHKLQLLEAEEYYCHGNLGCAREAYNTAIATACVHKFVNDEALANELAAKFYLNIGDPATSIFCYRHAHAKYEAWGATSKASKLHILLSNLSST